MGKPPKNANADGAKPADTTVGKPASQAGHSGATENGSNDKNTPGQDGISTLASSPTALGTGGVNEVEHPDGGGTGTQAREPELATAEHPGFALKVSSQVDGYYRAGRPWTRSPQVVQIDELDDGQVAALRGDREIHIDVVKWPIEGEE
jgi:hypothetical protein